jgi:ribosomal protein L29
MKASDLRQLTESQIQDEYVAAQRAYADSKLQPVGNSKLTRRDARRHIARILTIIRQQVVDR